MSDSDWCDSDWYSDEDENDDQGDDSTIGFDHYEHDCSDDYDTDCEGKEEYNMGFSEIEIKVGVVRDCLMFKYPALMLGDLCDDFIHSKGIDDTEIDHRAVLERYPGSYYWDDDCHDSACDDHEVWGEIDNPDNYYWDQDHLDYDDFSTIRSGEAKYRIMEEEEEEEGRVGSADQTRDDVVVYAGTGIGLEFRESGINLNAKNDRILKVGMFFNVSHGFQNLREQTNNPKTENFSLLLGDTVIVKENIPGVVTMISSKAVKDVAYSFNEDDEEDVKPKARAEPNGSEALFSKATLKSDNQEMPKEELRRQHQDELARRKNEDTAKRLVGGGSRAGDGRGVAKVSSDLIAYKNLNDVPPSRELMIQIDQRNEAIISLLYGSMAPFHVAAVKSDDDAEEEQVNQEEHPSLPDSSPPRISLPSKSSAPLVDDTMLALTVASKIQILNKPIDPVQHVVAYNPTYDQLWAPICGSAHPYANDGITQGMRNHKLWFVEDATIDTFGTYLGHGKEVRDISFPNDGTKFLSARYDKNIKYWDTETGQVISSFSTGKVPYVVKQNPDDDKQNILLAGMGDKKIVQWDMNSDAEVDTSTFNLWKRVPPDKIKGWFGSFKETTFKFWKEIPPDKGVDDTR